MMDYAAMKRMAYQASAAVGEREIVRPAREVDRAQAGRPLEAPPVLCRRGASGKYGALVHLHP